MKLFHASNEHVRIEIVTVQDLEQFRQIVRLRLCTGLHRLECTPHVLLTTVLDVRLCLLQRLSDLDATTYMTVGQLLHPTLLKTLQFLPLGALEEVCGNGSSEDHTHSEINIGLKATHMDHASNDILT